MTMQLSVVCTDRGQHAPAELAHFSWRPAWGDSQALVWDAGAPLRELDVTADGDSARGTQSAHPNKQIRRTPVERRVRADGGTTFTLPPCPRCHGRPVELRDDTLRRYVERTRDTPMEGQLDVAHIRMM